MNLYSACRKPKKAKIHGTINSINDELLISITISIQTRNMNQMKYIPKKYLVYSISIFINRKLKEHQKVLPLGILVEQILFISIIIFILDHVVYYPPPGTFCLGPCFLPLTSHNIISTSFALKLWSNKIIDVDNFICMKGAV